MNRCRCCYAWPAPRTACPSELRKEKVPMSQTQIHAVNDGIQTTNEERVEGAGGLGIFVRSWRPKTNARGVVVIVPGFNSHSGHYAWVAQQLTAAGLAVYAVDLRGRGHSDGERFFVEKISDWVSDVGTVMGLAKSRDSGL